MDFRAIFTRLACLLFTASLTASAFATAASIAVGGGTLSYTATTTTGTCWVGSPATYSQTNFTSFSYRDSSGVLWSGTSSGGTYFVSPGGSSCPPNGPQPTNDTVTVVSGTGFAINFHPCNGSFCTANIIYPGYINPKYVILGVTYAPPGPQSFVDYSNSTLLGSTVSISSSFATGVTNSIKVSRGITGWLTGSSSTSASTTYTQETDYGSTVTVNKQTTVSDKVPGPANAYVGLNHDYDVIWLWLNPVALFTVFDNHTVEWDGYGFSTMDQPVMDIYPVFVGWLNGDIPMTPSQSAPLARTWAAGQTWPAGDGPGLNSTDFQNILAADPYGRCTPTPSACPTSIDPGRYTLVTANQDFLYQQAPLGGQPLTQTYSETYTNTTANNQGYKYTYSQSYGTEQALSVKFIPQFSVTLSHTNTFTSSYQYNKQIVTGTSSNATLSITGPPCVVSGSTCNPVYAGSTQFDLYQDVLYGTFLLNPVN
jgi:hypothetical protein